MLPTEQEIESKCGSLFEDLGIEILRIPFSIESAKSSFLKTVLKVPPSDRTQEFKDGAIWADCIKLLMSNDVSLVTGDKAFYEGRQPSGGLAKNLALECEGLPFKVSLFPSLSEFVDELRVEIDIPDESLLTWLLHRTDSGVEKILARTGFSETEEVAMVDTSVFVTETPDSLAVNFSVNVPLSDIRGEGRTEASLSIKGECFFKQSSGEFSGIRIHEERVRFTASDGSQSETSNGYGYIDAHLGHREVQHAIRYPIRRQ